MKILGMICWIFFCLTPGLTDEVPKGSDFAFKREIKVRNDAPLQTFLLTADIYEHISSTRLNDLRIFNHAGSVVPFEIKVLESQRQFESQSIALPIFPITGIEKDGKKTNTTVELREDAKGKITSVHFKDQEFTPVSSNTYLVDLRGLSTQISSLKFSWESVEQMIPIYLEVSDDLKHWEVYGSGTLVNTSYLGNTITQDRIEGYFRPGKFMKISTPKNLTLKIQMVEATYLKQSLQQPDRQDLQAKLIEANVGNHTYLFDTGGVVPVRSVNIVFADQNIFQRIKISSRNHPSSSWIQRLDTTFYRIRLNGNELFSGYQEFTNLIPDRYWKLESMDREIVLSATPKLEFKWQPHRIIFLAQGEAPFFMSYGSARFENVPFKSNSHDALTKIVNADPAEASLGPVEVVRGEGALFPEVKAKSFPWKQVVLWSFLSVALLVGFVLARKLSKELSVNGKK